MPENARLNGSIDQIDLDSVEREATPRLLMKLSIQWYTWQKIIDDVASQQPSDTIEHFIHQVDARGHPWFCGRRS